MSASSGGPTGTSSVITDGTVKWRYYNPPEWLSHGLKGNPGSTLAATSTYNFFEVGFKETIVWDTPLNANKIGRIRNGTYPDGQRVRFVGTLNATGAYNLTINHQSEGTLTVLDQAGMWCDAEYTEALGQWLVTAKGSLA